MIRDNETLSAELDAAGRCIDGLSLAVKLTGEDMMEVARMVDADRVRTKAMIETLSSQIERIRNDQRITDRIVAELRRERNIQVAELPETPPLVGWPLSPSPTCHVPGETTDGA